MPHPTQIQRALSEHSRHLKNVFDSSPHSFRAQYITRRIVTDPIDWPPNLYSKVLPYCLCTPQSTSYVRLPRICKKPPSSPGTYSDV
ncbi:hypothetical protein BDZ89DRAFT_1200330 [Hymenopellis radicata]|nr:hypothetical protein BDZ89DRAFT_1200330 [Hymenopellis radicata]